MIHHPPNPRRLALARGAFSLVEVVICTIIVATMFAAGVSAAGAAARDRLTQREIRMGSQLARALMSEIVQQRYADPSPNTIAPTAGVNATDRTNWTHIDDYAGFSETSPSDRTGQKIAGATGWSWSAGVVYVQVSSPAGATGPSGGMLGGVLGAVGGSASALLDTTLTSGTDTGLKRITVTVTAPSGKVTTLTGLRCAAGAVDRTSTGIQVLTTINATVGADGRPVTTGAPLLNTPAIP